jgi:hypothetical protein
MPDAEPTGRSGGTRGPPLSSLPFARQATFWGFSLLLILAIAFYLWWGLSFGVWVDNGVYAVVVTLAGFGLAGMWLALPSPPRPIPADRR